MALTRFSPAPERSVRPGRLPGRKRALRRAGLSLACASALGAHLAAASQGPLAPTTAAPEAPVHALDVAVVPFLNLSRQPDDDWIGEGIAETVATDLRARGWTVTSCAHASGWGAARERAVPPSGEERAAGNGDNGDNGNGDNGNGDTDGDDGRRGSRDDGTAVDGCPGPRVRMQVAGAYERFGDQVQVTAEVVDVATGAVAHHARIDGPVGDLFALQDRLVSTLADGLAAVNGPSAASVTGSLAFEPAAGGGNAGAGGDARGAGASAGGDPGGAASGAGAIAGGRAEAGAGVNVGGRSRAGDRDRAAAAPSAPAPREPRAPQGTGRSGFTIGGRPRAVAARTNQPPRIDGRLDDAVWLSVEPITDFVQTSPVEGAPATERTEVWIAYDRDHLYLAFYAHYSDPGIIRANRAERDQSMGDDRMAVLFDPFLDQQRAYQFSVNGYGVPGDSIVNLSLIHI